MSDPTKPYILEAPPLRSSEDCPGQEHETPGDHQQLVKLARREHQWAVSRVAQHQQRICALQTELSRLNATTRKLKSHAESLVFQTKKHSEAIVKDSCRRLCHKMCIMLPFEIRDLVYEHLDFERDVDVFKGKGTCCGWTPYYAGRKVGNYVDATMVGDQVAEEIAERWYRNSVFIWHLYSHRDIESFTNHDILHQNLVPGDLVSRVLICVDWRSLEHLPLLLSLQPRVRITISVGECIAHYYHYEGMLEKLLPTLTIMRDGGHNVELTIWSGRPGSRSSHTFQIAEIFSEGFMDVYMDVRTKGAHGNIGNSLTT
ncbi:hypothetical protein BDV95DRAFT_575186 [Massariosphaeria phaeospora]|uniref:Uncharacterized protein n=1 Tax=Massariosphaeria phaeospora TaxID=100035 RepID=A0A7C8M6R9_9PLEO|nr:hypothetical protein BDV95DRAFT_575186 [Massariosphaeria phaeospora]